MREEKVFFAGDKLICRHFFDAEEKITVGQVLPDLGAGACIFLIRETALRRGLYIDAEGRKVFLEPFALGWDQRHAVIGGNFRLPD